MNLGPVAPTSVNSKWRLTDDFNRLTVFMLLIAVATPLRTLKATGKNKRNTSRISSNAKVIVSRIVKTIEQQGLIQTFVLGMEHQKPRGRANFRPKRMHNLCIEANVMFFITSCVKHMINKHEFHLSVTILQSETQQLMQRYVVRQPPSSIRTASSRYEKLLPY